MSTFKSIHTSYGLAKNAAAIASGTAINLTHMSVGDGNGNPVIVSALATQLFREKYRAPINRVYQDPADDPGMFTAELVIPHDQGGFVLREVGIWDESGGLYVYGNLPDTYKPAAADGAFSDAVIRLKFVVSNASIVTLQVDPNVAVATQSWVINAITAGVLLPGGTTGQVLAKASNTDGDTEWKNPDVANVVVDVIDEVQTLAAGQTAVVLTVCTTRGLALYASGARLRPDEWTADATELTHLTLAASYPAGTKLIAAQNDPQGNIPTPLQRQLNLSDVQSAAAARTNLSVYSKAEIDAAGFQPGMKCEFYGAAAPAGWFKANGAAVSRTVYARLFAVIGTTYGAGDGFTTFNLPDDRGHFSRAWDDGRGLDTGRVLGSVQAHAIASHNHGATAANTADHTHALTVAAAGQHNHTASAAASGIHSHDGGTADAGSHNHGFRDRYMAETPAALDNASNKEPMPPGYNGNEGTDGSDNDNTYFAYIDSATAAAGLHAHALNVSPSGSHVHDITVVAAANHTHAATAAAAGGHGHAITVAATGGAETRPTNRATLWCIKY